MPQAGKDLLLVFDNSFRLQQRTGRTVSTISKAEIRKIRTDRMQRTGECSIYRCQHLLIACRSWIFLHPKKLKNVDDKTIARTFVQSIQSLRRRIGHVEFHYHIDAVFGVTCFYRIRSYSRMEIFQQSWHRYQKQFKHRRREGKVNLSNLQER